MINLCDALHAVRARRAAYAALVRLDERSLEDIGMNRADVDRRWG
ncbi:DUF1127 domain-containing protein [Jannaschia formosa]|nr:DUF1127 domain-containing protein [Jannaschia formosa]